MLRDCGGKVGSGLGGGAALARRPLDISWDLILNPGVTPGAPRVSPQASRTPTPLPQFCISPHRVFSAPCKTLTQIPGSLSDTQLKELQCPPVPQSHSQSSVTPLPGVSQCLSVPQSLSQSLVPLPVTPCPQDCDPRSGPPSVPLSLFHTPIPLSVP